MVIKRIKYEITYMNKTAKFDEIISYPEECEYDEEIIITDKILCLLGTNNFKFNIINCSVIDEEEIQSNSSQ